jgi:hypothetical protein
MQQGEKNNQWGDITNTNLGTALEEAITGTADVTFASGNVTLTLTDTNASQTARNLRLNLVGTTAGARDLIVPAIEKLYFIYNDCADTITVKNTTGTGIAVPAGKAMVVFNNAANVVDGVTHLTSLTLGSALPVTSGGTGTTTSTGTGSVVLSNSPTLVTPALGTPASATLTNATGLPIDGGTINTLPVGRGGTGVTSLTSNGVLYGGATVGVTAVGTTGQVLVGNTGGAPSWGAATGVAVTSIGFGTTGLTPSAATQGVVTVAGTLAVANGGTGITSFGTGVATFLGTPSSANLLAALTTKTGTGLAVFDTSPTITSAVLVTPALGTPASGTLTSCDGLPIIAGTTGTLSVARGGTGATTLTSNGVVYGNGTGAVGVTAAGTTGQVLVGNTSGAPSWAAATGVAVTSISFGSTGLTPSTATQGVVTVAGTLAVANGGTGITSFGSGVATFLGTPSSANLAAAVTDETGSGSLVFATSPVLVTPNLGVPSFVTLTSATGLPIDAGTINTLPVGRGGTGVTSLTSNGILYGGATVGVTAAGTTGQVLVGNTGGAPSWAAATSTAVTSISFGSTGLTPSTATQGVVTVAGTLAVANGGTGVTTSTGTGSVVLNTTPTLVTPILGAASATSLALAAGLVATPSLTFTGDLNTGMWSPAADTIAWSTDGSERMRITSAGNVGIGTSSPADIGGYVSLALDDTTGSFTDFREAGVTRLRVGGDNGTAFINGATGVLRLLTSDIERMRIDGSGNVGIGTTAPTEKLDVVGNIELSGSGNRRLTFYTATNWRYNFASVSDNFNVYYADNTNFLQFFYSGTLANKRASVLGALHVLQGGNVGIGTTAPGSKLDVRGVIAGGDGNIQTVISYTNSDGVFGTLSAHGLAFYAAGFERMLINTSGQVTPNGDNTQNFGSGSLRWATIFANGVTISSATAMLTSSVSMNDGAAAAAGTLLNAPAAGNPTKWIPFNDNGTTRYIPAW